jgi:hypothetical protein
LDPGGVVVNRVDSESAKGVRLPHGHPVTAVGRKQYCPDFSHLLLHLTHLVISTFRIGNSF